MIFLPIKSNIEILICMYIIKLNKQQFDIGKAFDQYLLLLNIKNFHETNDV